MNLPPGIGEALLRALILGVALAWIAPAVCRSVAAHRWLWLFVLAPMLTPPVVVAFAYVGWSPGSPATLARELAYAVLLAARLLPIAVVLHFVLPAAPLSQAGRHCLELAGASGGRFHGPLRNRVIVAGLTFLFAFQEFELASVFFGVRSWSVAIFDAQVGGLPLAETLALASVPLGIEAFVLAAVAGLFVRTRTSSESLHPIESAPSAAWAWPLAATAVFTVWPACLLLGNLNAVGDQLPFAAKVWHSGVLAGGAVLCAGVIAWTAPVGVFVALAIPGLAGGLVLALGTVALFQLPGLSVAYDTPIPILFAWTLLLLPVATCFRLALDRLGAPRSVHLARLLEGAAESGQARSGRRLWFALRGVHVGLAAACLFLMAFFEVIAGQLLAPSGMTPAAPMLYNMMHYGRSPGLAAMVILMVAGAFATAGLGFGAWAVVRRGRWFSLGGRIRSTHG